MQQYVKNVVKTAWPKKGGIDKIHSIRRSLAHK
jgi:hypothetical protein